MIAPNNYDDLILNIMVAIKTMHAITSIMDNCLIKFIITALVIKMVASVVTRVVFIGDD